MKSLLLMRHAKSSWKDPKLTDHERPLNKRGKKDAPRMGQLLNERKLVPQLIVSSTARRARQTAEAVAEASGFEGNINFLDHLYMAEAEEFIQTLKEVPDEYDRVLIIGHNPGLETLLQVLSGKIEALPTAVIAYIKLPIEQWGALSPQTTGQVVEIWRPRELQKEDEKVITKKKKDK
jgi:phosphohistidine phosphatase